MVYHVYNRSISDYVIFNNDAEYSRMEEVLKYYRIKGPGQPFSYGDKLSKSGISHEAWSDKSMSSADRLVDIVAYCIMPTHLHLLLNEVAEEAIPIYVSNVLNSYTRYFNIRHDRKGPLWEGRTKKTLIVSNEQLLHVTRYIHLNPVTAYLVEKPEDWIYSSYREYISMKKDFDNMCKYDKLLKITPTSYRVFVECNIAYQRALAKEKATLPTS